MERGERDKIQLMGECFRRVYQSTFSDTDKTLLLDFIRTYYQLTPDEAEAFEALLRQETYQEVKEMELSYYGKLAQEAAKEAAKEAAEVAAKEASKQGVRQGIEQTLLELLKMKFSELPPDAVDRIRTIQSQDELTTLATNVLTANSLAEMGLSGID